MRVLITGGAGFLGSHLCDRFLAEGHTVIAMDNLITGSTDNIAHLAGYERFSYIKHDVTNYIFYRRAAGCDPALRLAGFSGRLPGAANSNAESRRAGHA